MNNKETIQLHNARLTENNSDLKNLFNKINDLPNKVAVEKHYLEGQNIIIVLTDGSKIIVDISEYIVTSGELTQEQIEAINNMEFFISADGDLIADYDDTLLDIEFFIDEGLLIANNNEEKLDFTINDLGEMEAIY